jgi:hypothetical protein
VDGKYLDFCGRLVAYLANAVPRFTIALVSLLFLWPPLNAVAQYPPSLNPLTSKSPQIEIPVLFTGLPAVVELPQSSLKSLFAKGDARSKCTTFTLVPYAGTLQEVRVTASGLGLVDFSRSDKNVPNQVTLGDLHPEGQTVNFCVHGELIREPASSVQGKLIAFAPGYKPATVNFKVERPTLAPWIKALQWFIAILLPVVLAGTFGAASAWVTSFIAQRREQKTVFRKFKDEKWNDLGVFFHTYLINVLREYQSEEEFAERLRLELQSRGYWTSIPWRERDRIERFIKQKKAARMRKVLVVLFREWEKDLSELHV